MIHDWPPLARRHLDPLPAPAAATASAVRRGEGSLLRRQPQLGWAQDPSRGMRMRRALGPVRRRDEVVPRGGLTAASSSVGDDGRNGGMPWP